MNFHKFKLHTKNKKKDVIKCFKAMLYKERKKRCDYSHLSIFRLKLPVTVLRIRYFHHYSNNYLMKNNADAVYHNVFLLKYYCHFCFDELVAVLDGDVFVVDQEIT